jgi:hypothetical protein
MDGRACMTVDGTQVVVAKQVFTGTGRPYPSNSRTLYWDTPDASLLHSLLREAAALVGRSVAGGLTVVMPSREYASCLMAAARAMMRVAGHDLLCGRLWLTEDAAAGELELSLRDPPSGRTVLASLPFSPDREAPTLLLVPARGLITALAALRGLRGVLEERGDGDGFAVVGAPTADRAVYERVLMEIMSAAAPVPPAPVPPAPVPPAPVPPAPAPPAPAPTAPAPSDEEEDPVGLSGT